MRALLSVADREGIIELTRGLTDAEIDCAATEDIRAHLAEAGIEVEPLPNLTDPGLLRAIGVRRDQSEDMAALAESGFDPIDIVVINLAPGREDLEAVSLLRAAAANHEWVAAVSSPTQYAS